MSKEKDSVKREPEYTPAAIPQDENENLATKGPYHEMANKSENENTHKPSNEEPSKKPQGNEAGSLALKESAAKLESIMSSDTTEQLNLDEETKRRYENLVTTLLNYSNEQKAFLSNDPADFPENMYPGTEAHARYNAKTDIIYLTKGPSDSSAFNTIIHEISHAHDKGSEELKRLLSFDAKWGDQESPQSEEYAYDSVDMLLTKVVHELNAEIDGNIIEHVEKSQSDQENLPMYKKRIDLWESRKFNGASSQSALKDWNKTLAIIQMGNSFESTLILDILKYREAAEKYILEEGEFPYVRSFTS